MDGVLNVNLNLCHSQKNPIMIQMKPTDTVRSVVEAARISTPPNTQLICLSHGSPLHLDLSLGKQGIQPNDTITVVYKKIRNSENIPVRNPSEIHQKAIFEERLRISDLWYLLLDYRLVSFAVYQEILNQQEKEHISPKSSKNSANQSTQFSDSDSCYTEDEEDAEYCSDEQFYTVEQQESNLEKTVIPTNPHISCNPLPTAWDTSPV